MEISDLHAALAASDYPLALYRALELWRETRDPAVADLIDRINARCTLPVPESRLPAEHQLWWVSRGRSNPDPVTIGGLLAVLHHRADSLDAAIEFVRARWVDQPRNPLTSHLGSSNRWPTNFQERIAVLLSWPDDPRISRAVVAIAASSQFPHAYGIPAMYEMLADRIGTMQDVRITEKLEAIAVEPRASQEVLRRLQVTFASRAIVAMSRRKAPRLVGSQLAECVALVPAPPAPEPPRPQLQIDALWKEVAANPDDVGVRAVLGDALVEAGDLRGDAIVLQCSARVPNRPLRGSGRTAYDGRVKTLLRMQWEAWFGDLALILPRRACEFRCGMLEVATVGLATSPEWAFSKAKGHRELACVHTVRPGWVTAEHFVTFLLGMPRFPKTLGVTGIDVIEALEKAGANFANLETVELMRSPVTGPNDRPLPDWTGKPLREALAKLAIAAPTLKNLVVRNHDIAQLFSDLRHQVRLLFPGLRKLAVDKETAVVVKDLVDNNLFTIA